MVSDRIEVCRWKKSKSGGDAGEILKVGIRGRLEKARLHGKEKTTKRIIEKKGRDEGSGGEKVEEKGVR